MAGAVCVAAIAVHYSRVVSGGSFWIFGDLRLDLAAGLLVLFLSVATFICVVPTMRRGGPIQAVVGAALLLLPIYVVGHFILWLCKVYDL